MGINSSKDFNEFLNSMIEQKVDKAVREKLNKYGTMRGFYAKVSSVNGDDTVNVTLAGDTTIIPSLLNKSNQTLIANDEVILFSVSNLTDAFVAVKK